MADGYENEKDKIEKSKDGWHRRHRRWMLDVLMQHHTLQGFDLLEFQIPSFF